MECDKEFETKQNSLHDVKSSKVSYIREEPEFIDIRDILSAFWNGKWLVLSITGVSIVISVLYALSLPNIYKSEALLAQEQGSGSGAMASQLGGLASLAGINLNNSKSDKTLVAIEIMKSRAFISSFIEKHDLVVPLMAVKGWDLNSNTLIFDENVYNEATGNWVRKVSPPLKRKPSLQESYKEFMEYISITRDPSTSLIRVSVQHYSPYIAQRWVNLLIEDINEKIKNDDLVEASNSIEYLNEQLEKTTVSEFKNVIFQLIEEQTKTIMFANVKTQYVMKTIDPAIVPELKFAPKRAIICIIGTTLGFVLGTIIALVRFFSKQRNSYDT